MVKTVRLSGCNVVGLLGCQEKNKGVSFSRNCAAVKNKTLDLSTESFDKVNWPP